MTSGKPKKTLSVPDAKKFGAFPSGAVTSLLKGAPDDAGDVYSVIAATVLSMTDLANPNHGNGAAIVALEALGKIRTPLANELIWSAAATATNLQVRIEAARRCGHVATEPEQRALLRSWAANGFQVNHGYNQDYRSVIEQRVAAITAMGDFHKPTSEDIGVVVSALKPPTQSHNREFPDGVFYAGVEAFWKIGSIEAFDDVVEILKSRGWRQGALELVGLGAKFKPSELQKHASDLWTNMRNYAQFWPTQEDAVTSRLLTLASKVGAPQHFVNWVSSFGNEGVGHGRGRVTMALVDGFKTHTDVTTKGLLALANHGQNLGAGGYVLSALKKACTQGHAHEIAASIVSQHSDGHKSLLQRGLFPDLFLSPEDALKHACRALSQTGNINDQRERAHGVASSFLVHATRGIPQDHGIGFSFEVLAARKNNPDYRGAREALAKAVQSLTDLDDEKNPVVLISRFLHQPDLASGAAAFVEDWLRLNDELSQYVMTIVIREAAAWNATEATANLKRVEEFLSQNRGRMDSVTAIRVFDTGLQEGVLVNGRVNQYAISTLLRRKLGWEKGVERVMSALRTKEDATFVFGILRSAGIQGLNAVLQGVRFHQDGGEELMAHVQVQAIRVAKDLCIAPGGEHKASELARHLVDRFQDMPSVRETAYIACGELGSFSTIQPLRERLTSELSPSAKKAIEASLNQLRDKLAGSKPASGSKSDLVVPWLSHVAHLGDVALLGSVAGYLSPPHGEQIVRQGALKAIASMGGPIALATVKKFIETNCPEGETLAVARQALLRLEDRADVDIFSALAFFFREDDKILDPSIDYDKVFGPELRTNLTVALTRSQRLYAGGHWDEFVTRVNSMMEGIIKYIFRTRYTLLGLTQEKGETQAKGNYGNIVNMTELRTRFPKLQSHALTIHACRSSASTAHIMNNDATPKSEIHTSEAEHVKDVFALAFAEAVQIFK